MPVEEKGETDVIITKELLEREKAKLEQLKSISAERKKLVSGPGATKEEKQGSREATAEVKKQKKILKDLKDRLKKIEKQQKEQDVKIKNFFGKAGDFASNPQQFVETTLNDLLQSTRAIPIIATIVAFGGVLFKLIEKEFGDGGIFDLRVRVKDIVRSIVSLKNLMDIDAGIIFMSPDTRLSFMPPETNNTESLRDGHVKYNQLTLGYGP